MDTNKRLDEALRLLTWAQQTSDRAEAAAYIAQARAIYPISKETISRVWGYIVPADARNAAEYRNIVAMRERIEAHA